MTLSPTSVDEVYQIYVSIVVGVVLRKIYIIICQSAGIFHQSGYVLVRAACRTRTTIVFDAPDSAYTAFASRFAGETLSDSDEMTDAANGEFLNLHDGLYAVNVSDEYSAIVNIDPQEYGRDITFKGNVRRRTIQQNGSAECCGVVK